MKSPMPTKRQGMNELEVFDILQSLYPDEIKDEDCEWDRIDEIINEKFEIGVDEFCNVAGALIYLTPKLSNALDGSRVHAFGVEVGDKGQFLAMCKREVAQ